MSIQTKAIKKLNGIAAVAIVSGTLLAGCAGGGLTTREKGAGIGALGGAAAGCLIGSAVRHPGGDRRSAAGSRKSGLRAGSADLPQSAGDQPPARAARTNTTARQRTLLGANISGAAPALCGIPYGNNGTILCLT